MPLDWGRSQFSLNCRLNIRRMLSPACGVCMAPPPTKPSSQDGGWGYRIQGSRRRPTSGDDRTVTLMTSSQQHGHLHKTIFSLHSSMDWWGLWAFTPNWGAIDSWWLLREGGSVFFKEVVGPQCSSGWSPTMRGWRREDVCMYGKHKWTLGFLLLLLFVYSKEKHEVKVWRVWGCRWEDLGEVWRMIVFKIPSLKFSKS